MNKRIILFFLMGMLLTGCSKTETVMSASKSTDDTSGLESAIEEDAETNTRVSSDSEIYVYVCGEVLTPGVYPLQENARICDALAKAGGVTKEGNPEALNQAQCVEDGQTIYVPSIYETTENQAEEDGLVDINVADKATFMTLPGIGESKAALIVEYREEHGRFQSIEDLMDIPGIKEGVFNKIKDYIKVS
ncbi:MAG: ComEA family DNA-binding protein [Lachnospiraceae bacterium]|nr:ComEA family DNA-binding protein [Lachnospiraceae bacterium]